MYSDQDISSAVAAGAISAEAADALRTHVSTLREMPQGDEENFRLINSFNDIFVAIGAVIMLIAMGAIGMATGGALAPFPIAPTSLDSEAAYQFYMDAEGVILALQTAVAGALIAITAWLLAEFFTRRRRMALPSIILLLAFAGGVFATIFGIGGTIFPNPSARMTVTIITIASLVTAGAAWLHWKRFHVPITIAAGAAAIAATVIGLIMMVIGPDNIDDPENIFLPLIFISGLAVFAWAMRWDMSDRERVTRRSDVAFWLHLLAAPMIAHPIFALIGVTGNDELSAGAAVAVLAIYAGFGLIALAIDRRAILVSALAYVLGALTFLFDNFGNIELTFALTALVIGSALLTLSAFWSPLRNKVVALLPSGLQAKLSPTAATVTMPAEAAAA